MEANINEIMEDAFQTANNNGFWDHSKDEFATQMALIHTEVSEATAAYRNFEDLEHVAEELADVIIRTANVCKRFGLDLEGAILKKLEFNKSRPYMHGNKRF